MKAWVLANFYLARKMDKLAERIDEEIDRSSLLLKIDTATLFEVIFNLNDKKRRVVNFKVLHSMLLKQLYLQEMGIISRYIKGQTLEEIGKEYEISKSTVSRRLKQAIDKCIKIFESLQFTEERLEKEYAEIPLIYKAVRKFKC